MARATEAAIEPAPLWRRPAVLIGLGGMLVLAWIGDLLAFGFVAGVGVLFFLGAAQLWRQARDIADTPTSTIRGAAQGRVELNVRTPADKPLIAPLSEEECSFWHLTVQREVIRGQEKTLKTVAETWSGGPWQEVTDGTGTCLLAMPEATITSRLTLSRTIIGNGLEGLGKYFKSEERPELHARGHKVVVEHRFPVDAQIHVIGLFESVTSNRTPFDEDWTDRVLRQGAAAPAGARKLAQMTQQVTANKREQLKEEWRARMRVLEGIPKGAPLGGTVVVHTMRQDVRQNRTFPLLISDLEEHAVIKKLRLGAGGALVAGVLTLVFAVVLLALARPDVGDALLRVLR